MTLPAEFSSFVSEFDSNINEIKSLLAAIADQTNEISQRELLKRSSSLRDDSVVLLTSITPRVRHYQYQQKMKCQKKLRDCDDCIDDVNNMMAAAEANIKTKKNNNNARNELIDDYKNNHGGKYERLTDQRERLLNVRSLMNEGDESLNNTEALIAQSIDIGTDTATTLIQQREQLSHQSQSLKVSDENLTDSSRTMRRIGWRIFTNRIFGLIVVIALIIANGIVVWIKYFH